SGICSRVSYSQGFHRERSISVLAKNSDLGIQYGPMTAIYLPSCPTTGPGSARACISTQAHPGFQGIERILLKALQTAGSFLLDTNQGTRHNLKRFSQAQHTRGDSDRTRAPRRGRSIPA